MVDYSLQPFSRMLKLKNKCSLIWIDHHETAIKDAEQSGVKFQGIQKDGIGACQLVWNYIYPDKEVPAGVEHLARYDVWDHSHEDTIPFQYGFRMYDTWPKTNSSLWEDILNNYNHNVPKIVKEGKLILNYEKSQNEKFCKAYSFYTEFEGYKAIAVNKGFTNSQLFDSVQEDDYEIMITFCRLELPAKKWTVSMYTKRDDIDVGIIAKKYGGGGHKQAAGFQCEKIPFEY